MDDDDLIAEGSASASEPWYENAWEILTSPFRNAGQDVSNGGVYVEQGLTNLGQSIDDAIPTSTELLVGAGVVIVVLVLILMLLGKIEAL